MAKIKYFPVYIFKDLEKSPYILVGNVSHLGKCRNCEIYLSEMDKNGIKLSTMVRENFEIYLSEMAKNGLKLSTMVGEIF